MKKFKISILFFIIYMLIVPVVHVNAADYIYFDLAKGSVTFTDSKYSGKDSSGTAVTGTHVETNHYVISQTNSSKATTNRISVGTAKFGEVNSAYIVTSVTPVTKDFIIELNGVNIQQSSSDESPFMVNAKSPSTVVVILKDNTKNILYSKKDRAALEKAGGASSNGTLVLTCENGYAAWLDDSNSGHVKSDCSSACNSICGSLDARVGGAWLDSYDGKAYRSGAAIGTCGGGTGGSTSSSSAAKGTNALVNLTIAGGNIFAQGDGGYTDTRKAGGSAAIGTGSCDDQTLIGGTIHGLKITGGNIEAIRGDDSASSIGGGYRAGYVNVDIYGGTIKALNNTIFTNNRVKGTGIGGGGGGSSTSAPSGATVNIYGGTINAFSQYGAAIGGGAGGTTGSAENAIVNIYDGKITAITTKGDGNGAGAGIGTGGSAGDGTAGDATINIYGGTINASSELGVDIGGGGTNSTSTTGTGGKGIITINDGNIHAMTGGIGGGRANAGKGGDTEIIIYDGNIETVRIGGGNSTSGNGGAAIITIEDGTLETETIGGGLTGSSKASIGYASATIKGGDIVGQFIMAKGTTGPCTFTMTGGIIHDSNPLESTSSYVKKNGGAVYIDDPTAVAILSGGTIKNCSAENGGAIYMTAGTFTLSGTGNIEDCYVTGKGGAITILGGTVDVENGKIQECSAAYGGAIYLSGGDFTMTGGNIIDNTSTESGGGIHISDGNVYISGGKISDNLARGETSNTGYGGGIFVDGGEEVSIRGGEISNNIAAKNGGGLEVKTDKTVTVEIYSGIFEYNVAEDSGGAVGIECSNGTINVGEMDCDGSDEGGHIHPVLRNNVAGLHGGGFYMSGANAILNIACASIDNNKIGDVENNFEQLSGTITIYEGVDIGSNKEGIIVIGGEFVDRSQIAEEKSQVVYYCNYEESPDYKSASVTSGSSITLPGNIFGVEGYEVLGWTTNSADTNTIEYNVGQMIEIENNTSIYALWVLEEKNEPSFIVVIPSEIELDSNMQSTTFEINATLVLFPRTKALTVSLMELDNNLLLLHDNEFVSQITYKMTKEDGTEVTSDENMILTMYSDTALIEQKESCECEVILLDNPKYAGDYKNNITFKCEMIDV